MGKTGRLNLEMNDWMGNQNKKREKLTDSDILKQFEQAEKDTRFLPINPPPKDEFDQIWSRIQAEQALFSEISNTTNTKSSRKTRRRPVRKALVVGLAAAIMVIGGCFVAMGTKSYFYRDGRRVSNGVVYNNDSNVLTVRDEEEAYDKIAEELGVKTLKLGYMPEGMYFENLVIEDGYGRLQYNCKTSRVFFVQTKSDKKTSRIHASDAKENHKIWNSILHMDIDVYMENIETAILLMVVGMATVFVILLIVIYLGKFLITLVNKYAPEEVLPAKKETQKGPAPIPGNVEKNSFLTYWRFNEKSNTFSNKLLSIDKCVYGNCICINTFSRSVYIG